MRELSRREKVILAVVAVAVIGALVQRFVLEPQSRKLRELRKELLSLNEQTANIAPKLVEFNKLNSNLANKERQLAELEQVLSKKSEVAEVIHEVSRQARTKGLRIQQLRPERTRVMRTRGGKLGGFRQLVVNLGIQGRYQELGDFIAALEQQPFFVKVAELSVERGQARGPLLNIKMKLTVVMRS